MSINEGEADNSNIKSNKDIAATKKFKTPTLQ